MYQTTLDDIKLVIELNKPLNVVKLKIREYLEAEQYRQWLQQKKEQYEQEYPEFDEDGNPIKYTDEKYTIDEDGNEIENENYKPSFEEWLNIKGYIFEFNPNNVDFTEVKPLLKQYAKQLFLQEPKKGMLSPSLNVVINAERHDLDNMKNLLEFMKLSNVDKVNFRLYDNSFIELNQEQLQTLITELISYGMQLYQKKWQFEHQVDNLVSIADLDSLVW